ncbi:MAG TPA: nicotinate-nucleotide--dimethylbenzimidazole phosphoribosyltransferase [Solirubrobacteraceae bacterium]|jgi:nicotinate-nucleotide--dimethylbenzimidazole phosphoribosyltransferase|nr:nicotinate-nucleotide--dimethylbenzimidazole phosphoribosyltransferase [Solirubrobacteraceae bacterium]
MTDDQRPAGLDERFTRPPTPPGFDRSRAAERAADPRGWRYDDAERATVHRVIAERRDVRRFRPDAVDDDILGRVLAAAHRAPSVGLMQPWRLIVIRDIDTRMAVRRLAQRERLRQADRFDERTRQFLDQKVEGVIEAPIGVCVCCDHGQPDVEVLGRGTIPDTDIYSAACAVQNLWLAARAEGLGVGWVSFYRPEDLRALLGIPARVDPIAYLCLGWPDERPLRPGLEAAGWSSRMTLDAVVMDERWREDHASPITAGGRQPVASHAHAPDLVADRAPVAPRIGPDRAAAIAARDRLDRLVKPVGSLGALEALIERWAAVTGGPPPSRARAGVLICAADHGHVGRGTSLFDSAVSAQVAAAAARGETAVGVLARRGGHDLLVVDVGLAGPTPPGVRDAKIAPGSADMTTGPALSAAELDSALDTGAALARELAERDVDCLVLGEIGIGNTATTAALVCALTGASPQLAVGRGTGVDAAGLERKRAIVTAALERHGAPGEPRPLAAREALCRVGGLELAALAGAAVEAVRVRLPVLLDGYAVTVAALAAVGLDPAVGEVLIASHRSAEPGHDILLAELGLEPLLDLRLRLGEASGALLALPLIEAAGTLHAGMGTFEESGVARSR